MLLRQAKAHWRLSSLNCSRCHRQYRERKQHLYGWLHLVLVCPACSHRQEIPLAVPALGPTGSSPEPDSNYCTPEQ